MKSGGPWNLRGLRPETRAAAREAARASGMSVGEWLNDVIQPTDEDDGARWSGGFDHEAEARRPPRSRYEEREPDRYHDAPSPRRRGERMPESRARQDARHDQDARDWNNHRRDDNSRGRSSDRDTPPPQRRRDRSEYDDTLVRPEGRPYREERRPRPHRERPYDDTVASALRPPVPDRDTSIDRAVAEIEARQRVLDSKATAETEARQQALKGEAAAESLAPQGALGGNAAAGVKAQQQPLDSNATAEIKARQRALDDGPSQRSFSEREPQPLPSQPREGGSADNDAPHARHAAEVFDMGGLEQQLRQLTTKIEALRPSAELEAAINGLRGDLSEIGRSFTEALPRRALDSLEIEIKALAERVDHSRQNGVDPSALSGVERGLADVNEALRTLKPAESLIGFDEAIKALSKRVDAIVARDDPTALQQLEAAIGGLRGIVSHVASNDTLNRVADDVRALSAKVDALASMPPSLSSLESRLDLLTNALKNSTEAGHAVPRELEKLLSGLIEKLEWVQLTHTDHTALAHLEDRIASLVKRLDASDARLGMLEGVERGLADILVYIEQLRSAGGIGDVAAARPVAVETIEHDVAKIKEAERRTQDSLEDMHGTVEQVVDRLAMIESDRRVDNTREALVEPFAPTAQEPEPEPASLEPPPETVPAEVPPTELTSDTPAAAPAPGPPAPRPAKARMPIDPNLPPDHPLEPGSASRARPQPSAADRIAASEAAIRSKPPVIPDPSGGKSDFIAAARRAAKAAALGSPTDKPSTKADAAAAPPAKKLTERLRTFAVAAAVVVILVGGLRIASRMFLDGGSSAPPQASTQPSRLQGGSPKVVSEPARPKIEAPAQIEPPGAPAEPPRPQSEPPPPAAAPLASPAPLPKVISVPPGTDSTKSPGATAPIAPSPPANGVAPGQQSQWAPPQAVPLAMTVSPSPDSDKAPAEQGAPAPAIAPPIDITGSLPSASAQHSAAAGSGQAIDEKLPIAIGSPALRAAAVAGDPTAAYEVAVRFAEGRAVAQNNKEAARWFEVAAKKGLAPAQFRLGTLYEKGLGVKKDLVMARDFYRAAAEKGHGKAMHNLAVLYAEGVDGKADYRTAAQWFRKAADRGVTDSEYNLAVLYARGVGVEQNFAEAYKWFFIAAKDGDQDAAEKRDEIAARLDQQALAAARLTAEKWVPIAQPADVITVKRAWDAPAPKSAKPKSRSAKTSMPGGAKID
jgi:localization factor PodJL